MYRSTRLNPPKAKPQKIMNENSKLLSMKPLFEDIKAPFPVKFIIFSCNYGLNFKNLQLFAYACSQLQIISVLIITVIKSFNSLSVEHLTNCPYANFSRKDPLQCLCCINIGTHSAVEHKTILSTRVQRVNEGNNNWFHKAFVTVSDIFSVAGLFDFAQSSRVSILLAVIIALLLALIAATIVYISVCIKIGKTPSYRIQLAWCGLIDIYPTILAYPIHFIYLQFLYNYQQNQWATKINHASLQAAKAFLILGLILNFVYAFGSLVYFRIQIKTKDLFSAKTSLIEIFDFMLYKTLLPIFFVFCAPEDSLYITLLCINLGYALIRDWLFFWFLPFYRIPVLKAAAKVHSLLTALALSAFLSKIITFERTKENFAFTALLWLAFASLLSRFHTKYLWKLLLEIIGEPGKAMNQYHLLHYWDVYKYLTARCKAIRPKAQKSDEKYLLYHIALNQIKTVQQKPEKLKTFKSQVSFLYEADTEDPFETDRFVQFENLKLLKASAQRSPHNWLIKMHLARYYLKYKSYYILADDLVNEVLKDSLFLSQKAPLYIVKLQLLHRVNKREIDNEGDSHATGLNIQTYLKSQSMFNEFKATILNQLKPQMRFWNGFEGNSLDCGLLMSLAKQVCTQADKVKKHWTHYRQVIDLNFTKPLLIYGFYQAFSQNDFEAGDKLISEFYDYELIREKKKAEFNRGEQDALLLTPDTLFFEISGSSSSMGKVIDCSSGVVKCFGYVRDFLIGKSINILMPTFFGERHDNFLRNSQDSIQSKVLNKSREITIIDKHGYLKVCQIYITWRFNPQIGLCYYVLLRQRENSKETVLLDEKGQLLNYSRGFEIDMGFEKNVTSTMTSSFNIYTLCPKLEEIVCAATTVAGEFRPGSVSLNRFQTGGNYSQAQLSSSHRIKTLQFDKVDTSRANLDLDYYSGLYEKYSKGDTLSFQALNKRKRDKPSTTKKDTFVSYNTKVELCTYEDGGKIIKLSLLKNKEIGTYWDDTHLYTIETQNELISPYTATIQKDDQQSVTTLSPAIVWSPDDKRSILKKKSAFGKTPRITEENDYNPYTISSRQKLIPTPKSPPTGKVFRFDTDAVATGTNMPLSSPREDLLEARVKTMRSQIYKSRGDFDGMLTEDDDAPLKVMSPTGTTTTQAKPKAGVNVRIQEENILAKENLVQKQFGRAESSQGSITLERLKTFRLLRKLSKVRKYGRSTILFNFHFIITTAFLIAVLIWLNYKSLAASNKSADYTRVLEALRYRNVWVNIANQETRFWSAIQGGWLGWTLQSEILTTNLTWTKTNYYNQKLMKAITYLDTSQQELFFEKDVGVYVRNSTNSKVFESYQNTFDVVDRLIDRGFKNVYRKAPTSILKNFTGPDARFIFDNSFDDLFIRSENLVTLMENGFLDSLSNIKSDMRVGLGFAIALVGLLGIVAFYYTWSINNEIYKFLTVLFSIQSKEIQRISSALSIYYEILTKEQEEYDRTDSGDAVQTYFDLKRKQVLETSKLFNSAKTRAKEPSQASLFKIYLTNYLFFVCLCVVLVAKIVFVYVYYNQGLKNISTIEVHQSQINMALNNMKSHSLISAGLQSLVIDNATSTIKNRPILEGLTAEIDSMDSINDLYNAFGDQNGISSARVKQLLFNLTCSGSYSPEYINPSSTSISQCNRLSKGLGWLGLVEVLSILVTNLQQFFAMYKAADKSTATALRTIYVKIPNGQIQAIDLSITYSLLLFEATIENFEDLSARLDSQRTTLTWVAFVFSFLLAIAAWKLIIKKLADKQFYKKDMLSLLPIKLLYNNRMLKKYATTN